MKSRVLAWKARWLSLSGRIIVLSAIPNYYFSFLQAPKSILGQIEKLIWAFLWTTNMTGEKKLPLISLSEMSSSPSTGGVGLHNMFAHNLAFCGKLVWKLFSQPNAKWCQLMQEKYLDNLDSTRILIVLDPPKDSAI